MLPEASPKIFREPYIEDKTFECRKRIASRFSGNKTLPITSEILSLIGNRVEISNVHSSIFVDMDDLWSALVISWATRRIAAVFNPLAVPPLVHH